MDELEELKETLERMRAGRADALEKLEMRIALAAQPDHPGHALAVQQLPMFRNVLAQFEQAEGHAIRNLEEALAESDRANLEA